MIREVAGTRLYRTVWANMRSLAFTLSNMGSHWRTLNKKIYISYLLESIPGCCMETGPYERTKGKQVGRLVIAKVENDGVFHQG